MGIMEIDFCNIEYLLSGNKKQKLAYATLYKNKVLTKLKQFDPILVGTIPIEIDIENSDLDIIYHANNLQKFKKTIETNFGDKENFKIWKRIEREHNAIVANFKLGSFIIEIFGQDTPTKQQNAYRHMIIEHKLLKKHETKFRQQIIELKRQGYKTELAFGILLGLRNNPYTELLNYEI